MSAECHKLKSRIEAETRAAGQYAAPAPADTPLDFLTGVMNDPAQDPRLRVRAAVAAAQYVHAKRAEGGKKEEQDRAAKAAARGRFKPVAPPKLVVNNR